MDTYRNSAPPPLDPSVDFWVKPWERLPTEQLWIWAHTTIFVRPLLEREQRDYIVGCLRPRIDALERGRFAGLRAGTHAVQVCWTPTTTQEANRDMRYLVREITGFLAGYLRIQKPNVAFIGNGDSGLRLEQRLLNRNAWQ